MAELLRFQIWWFLVWQGIVQFSMIWYGMTWQSLWVFSRSTTIKIWSSQLENWPSYCCFKFGGIGYGRVQFGIVWCGMTWYSLWVFSRSTIMQNLELLALKMAELLLFQFCWYLVQWGIVWYSMVWYDMVQSVGIVQIYYHAKFGAPSFKNG